MEKYEHLPEVAELNRFVLENNVDVSTADELMGSLRWASGQFQAVPIPPSTFWELVSKIAAAGLAIIKEEGA